MTSIQRLKGMPDVLSEDRPYWDWIIDTATRLAQQFGFERIDVPIIESTDLFARGVGEASDFFVQKEMYTIVEEDGSSITLRPEFTASLVRAYVQHGMHNKKQPVKLFTIGPAFRRERPQAGRFRQHSQFDIEVLGETDPVADLEIMMLAASLYRELGYPALAFQLNSTGCSACKPAFVEALVGYLQQHEDKLAKVDKDRLGLNPLRVLDSKERGMNELLADAPHIVDYLCEDCASHFGELCMHLDALGQEYKINHRLVRGIDYYTKTVFEVFDNSIGAQGAISGGGRYDGLAEAIGGNSTPGVGAGMGIERIILGLKQHGIEPPASYLAVAPVYIAHFGGETKKTAVSLTYTLRAAGIGTRIAFARDKRSMKSQMKEANKRESRFVIMLGEDELEKQEALIRRMDGGEQESVPFAELVDWLKGNGA